MTTELPLELKQLVSLQSNESIINAWPDSTSLASYPSGWANELVKNRLVLTNFRIIALHSDNPKKQPYYVTLNRDLKDIAPPRYFEQTIDGITDHLISVGGMTFSGSQAMADDIEFARSRVIPPDVPSSSGDSGNRQVIIKEIVKIPCSYCHTLNLQTDQKCATCGARLL